MGFVLGGNIRQCCPGAIVLLHFILYIFFYFFKYYGAVGAAAGQKCFVKKCPMNNVE